MYTPHDIFFTLATVFLIVHGANRLLSGYRHKIRHHFYDRQDIEELQIKVSDLIDRLDELQGVRKENT